ncbi:MAG TPA: hypothetical protein PLX89_26640, partial [Verrucomicrobiota bacterium]|nr:hypothetical protein [Verrucomicrobiota bacterium]
PLLRDLPEAAVPSPEQKARWERQRRTANVDRSRRGDEAHFPLRTLASIVPSASTRAAGSARPAVRGYSGSRQGDEAHSADASPTATAVGEGAQRADEGSSNAELGMRNAESEPTYAGLELPERATTELPHWPRTPEGRLIAIAEAGALNLFVIREVPRPGVVLDYTVVNTTANMVFDSLTTYYVPGPVNLSTSVKFHPGTVIKFAKTNSPSLTILNGTTITWLGAPYRPIILTSYDDTSVGEPLPAASGSPSGTYAATALSLNGFGLTSGLVLSNLCVRHAAVGVAATYFSIDGPFTLRHAQFVQCGTAMRFTQGSGISSTQDTYFPQNVLVVGDPSSTKVFGNLYFAKIGAEFMTIDGATTLRHTTYNPDYSTVTLVNSILANVNDSSNVTLVNSGTPDCSPLFSAVGAGAHYLDRTRTCLLDTWLTIHAAFPPNPLASPGLGAELATMTQMPPVPVASTFTANTVLGGAVWADAAYAIGYHYPRVDYLMTSAINVTGATLTLSGGAVLLGYTGQAIVLNSGARLVSIGKPNALNGLGWSSGVQEMPIGGPPAAATTRKLIEISSASGDWPEVRMRFTQANVCADSSGRRALFTANTTSQNVSVIDLRDCQFGGVVADFSPVTYGSQSLSLVNNVWDKCTVGAYRSYAGVQPVYLRNNLFRSGSLTLYYNYFEAYGNPVWICADNLFDTTSLAGSAWRPTIWWPAGTPIRPRPRFLAGWATKWG